MVAREPARLTIFAPSAQPSFTPRENIALGAILIKGFKRSLGTTVYLSFGLQSRSPNQLTLRPRTVPDENLGFRSGRARGFRPRLRFPTRIFGSRHYRLAHRAAQRACGNGKGLRLLAFPIHVSAHVFCL